MKKEEHHEEKSKHHSHHKKVAHHLEKAHEILEKMRLKEMKPSHHKKSHKAK